MFWKILDIFENISKTVQQLLIKVSFGCKHFWTNFKFLTTLLTFSTVYNIRVFKTGFLASVIFAAYSN